MIGREFTARALQVSRSFSATQFCESIKSNPSGRQMKAKLLCFNTEPPLEFQPFEKSLYSRCAVSTGGRPAQGCDVRLKQPLVETAQHPHRVDKALHAWDDSGPRRPIRQSLEAGTGR